VTSLIPHPRYTRLIWTVLVALYFIVFFVNFFRDAAPAGTLFPLLLAVLFVGWLSLEYYYGSPFFQSGVVEPSAFWRGVFAFFVYPYFGYLAADFIWWHWTQLPVPGAVSGAVGLALFGFGVYLRLATLRGLLRVAVSKTAAGPKGKQVVSSVTIPEKRFVGLPLQRVARHPRYLATLVQLLGAALVFRSWGGVVLTVAVGLPMILAQAGFEDRRLRDSLRSEYQAYSAAVPFFWPALRRQAR